MSEFWFYSITWKQIDKMRLNFVYLLSSTRSTSVIWITVFPKFAKGLRPLIDVRFWFLLNVLRTNWHNETKFCIHIIIDKIYVGIVNCCVSQICYRLTTLDRCKNLVFAPHLKNEGTELTKILYTHYLWQDLRWDCKASFFFANFQQSYNPWLNSEFGLQIWVPLTNWKNLSLTRELFKNTWLFSGERSLPFGQLVIALSFKLSQLIEDDVKIKKIIILFSLN